MHVAFSAITICKIANGSTESSSPGISYIFAAFTHTHFHEKRMLRGDLRFNNDLSVCVIRINIYMHGDKRDNFIDGIAERFAIAILRDNLYL